ncbi:MAG TPA: ribonuclease M5 [Candidatus Salinicoccus stercoripullorum]|uniref:Ribonuclease M5 n=1 Tax=Candidatus Salinicoccus stercoripullorum TaxID=2838756 RepID=A0A9D1U0C9_9STAP|nr:ribonuclease M5 [Candidatus Salinicoccus stercoripullorum]
MEKPVIKEVIIVEGRDDTRRLNEAVSCETIETKGSAIDDTVMDEIEVALSTRGAIIFTDPDFPGHKIRNTILERFPGIKEAFLPRDKAKGRLGGIGIEHASIEAIRESLSQVYTNMVVTEETVTIRDMTGWGLSGTSEAAVRRRHLCDRLNIGYANAGQLRKKLNRYNIDKARIANILEELTGE